MIFINGRFLSRTVTGVERFATELVRVLDNAVEKPDDYCVLAPHGVPRPAWLQRLGFANCGRLQGHAWEQIELLRASRQGKLLNLCNSGPILHPRSLVVLHDAWVFRHPEHFSPAYRIFHQALDRVLARRTRIATVSHFSRNELASILGLDAARIAIIPNAADHLDRIAPATEVIDDLRLNQSRYLLLVGSFAPNKNMPMAIRAFLDCAKPDEKLVIVGAKVGVFANDDLSDLPASVILAGRVEDSQLTALYGNAHALLFPSLYEGFGIPPLEAMRLCTPVVASDIAVVKEVCGDAGYYFDAQKPCSIAAAIRRIFDDNPLHSRLRSAARERAVHYSWQVSANALSQIANDL